MRHNGEISLFRKALLGFISLGWQGIRIEIGMLKTGNLIYSVDNSIVVNRTWLKNGDGLDERFNDFLKNWKHRERSIRNYLKESGLLLRSLTLIMQWVNFSYRGVTKFSSVKASKVSRSFLKVSRSLKSKCHEVFLCWDIKSVTKFLSEVSRSILTLCNNTRKNFIESKDLTLT